MEDELPLEGRVAGEGDLELAEISEEPEGEFRQEVLAAPRRTLEAVDEAAEMWDAAWEISKGAGLGGRLHLPVLAGIRRGSVLARVEVTGSAKGSDVLLRVEDSAYEVNRGAAMFLLLGALGGILAMLWPLFPKQLLSFAPFGLVLAIGAWLLVVSRLRTAGPRDFLEAVAELAEEGEDGVVDREPEAEPLSSKPIDP